MRMDAELAVNLLFSHRLRRGRNVECDRAEHHTNTGDPVNEQSQLTHGLFHDRE